MTYAVVAVGVLFSDAEMFAHRWRHIARPVVVMAVLAALMVLAIALLVKGTKWGAIVGLVCGTLTLAQCIVVHAILRFPFVSGIWWYPFYTFFQGVLIVYFATLALRKGGKK